MGPMVDTARVLAYKLKRITHLLNTFNFLPNHLPPSSNLSRRIQKVSIHKCLYLGLRTIV